MTNSNDSIEVGDFLKIDFKSYVKEFVGTDQHAFYKKTKCKNPDKIFEICRVSHSKQSIFYLDNRTNNSCKCVACSHLFVQRNVGLVHGSKCLNIKFIHLIKKVEMERNKKISSIFKNIKTVLD